ncbi:hypothetical protein Dimus_009143 [Dionaea muscipula]
MSFPESFDAYDHVDAVIAQPLTPEASIKESVAVSGNNAERKHSSKEPVGENDKKAEDGANLMNTGGPMDTPGLEEEKGDKNELRNGGDAVNMVDEMIKEYLNDVPCEELKNREMTVVCEAKAKMPMFVSESDTKTLNCSNITGEAKETDQIQLGDSSGKKKVKKLKKSIIKKKVVVPKRKMVPESEELKSGEPTAVFGSNAEASMLVSEPGMEEENVTLECTHIAEEKETAQVQIGDSSAKEKAKKPKKIVKKKVVVQTRKLVPKNEAEGQPLNVEKPGDELKDASTNSKVSQEEKVETKNVDEVKSNKVKAEDRRKRSRKRSRPEVAKAEGIDSSAKDNDKAETSNKKKPEKNKVNSMGMIFMCSSKTKKDCYLYKVMGLPASKKDVVSKVYKGMRLFLFDFDLRLLYGIYKAAGPGGYNIEPRAFKSDFPSQVRFTLVEDCLPIPEEKFKKVIKDNYYARNKFNCELTSEQVKNLCELFQAGGRSKEKGKAIKAERASGRERRGSRRERAPVSSSRKQDRSRKRTHDELRRDRARQEEDYKRQAMDNGYDRYDRHPPAYERREAFVPIVAAPVALPPLTRALHPPLTQGPARGLGYVYDSTSRPDIYMRDVAYEQRDYGQPSALDLYRQDQVLPSLEARRLRDEPEPRDPYDAYREPRAYPESQYSAAGAVLDYYSYPRAEYLAPVGRSVVYRDADTLYRRY